MARSKGIPLTSQKERDDADELRAAVKEVICEKESERRQYQEAVTAITVDEPLNRSFFADTASALDDLTSGEASPNYWCDVVVKFQRLRWWRYLPTLDLAKMAPKPSACLRVVVGGNEGLNYVGIVN
ncbi:Acetylglutamate kinase [Bienertia sinuspersici]